MQYEFGFIGVGNMGGALANAVCGALPAGKVAVCDADEKKTAAFVKQYGAAALPLDKITGACRFLVLGVKPQVLPSVLSAIRPTLADSTVLVSMAAGISISAIENAIPNKPVVRIMPNTPCAVGRGLILYAKNAYVTDDDLSAFLAGFSKAGTLVPIAEDKIDAASAVSGCGPAFAYLFVEALADAGVECGLTRADAQKFAALMLEGSAKMVLETGRHPGELKDAVCSPGGTTIAGVRALEEGGFRSAAMNAVRAAYLRTLELKK
ncbi:MAG: pyrroline-5-carboxylate reductase [Clostridia bacterium]|nr:pyrroline-5-carboxylate reductase [Clostridia bacterium]